MLCSSPKINRNISRTETQDLRTLVINFQSAKNKIPQILNLIESSEPKIILGTETWLNKNISSSEIFSPDFSVHRKDREDEYGGVLIAVKSNLQHEPIQCNDAIEAKFIKITNVDKHCLIVGSVYRPPNSSLEYMEALCSAIETIVFANMNATVWFGGDFNLPDINWACD